MTVLAYLNGDSRNGVNENENGARLDIGHFRLTNKGLVPSRGTRARD